MARIRTMVVGGAVGATLAYFFDPRSGPGRRARLWDGLGAALRRGARDLDAAARRLGGGARMAVARDERAAGAAPDDLALLGRVESALSDVPGLPRGALEVEVTGGRVVLRGEVADEGTSREVAGAASQVAGVAGVDNRVRVRGAAAPEGPAA